MAPSERHPLTVLDPRTQAAIARARETGFFALISTLERLQPSAERVGGYGPVAQEALRFRNDPSMGFSASDVSDAAIIKVDGAGGRSREVVEVTTTFLGLTGSVSPLPLHIPAEVAHESGPRNVQRDFLD